MGVNLYCRGCYQRYKCVRQLCFPSYPFPLLYSLSTPFHISLLLSLLYIHLLCFSTLYLTPSCFARRRTQSDPPFPVMQYIKNFWTRLYTSWFTISSRCALEHSISSKTFWSSDAMLFRRSMTFWSQSWSGRKTIYFFVRLFATDLDSSNK